MADGHGEATEWEGPYNPLLVQDDFDDDVMYLLDMPAVVLDPAPLAVAQDNLLEWPATNYLNNNSVDSRVPAHDAAVAGDRPCSTQYVGGGAGTSATASTSAAAAHDENALLDCSGCQVLREVLHSNGRRTY